MICNENLGPSMAAVVRDLDAVRRRLDQTSARSRGGQRTVRAAALATQVRFLCQEVSGLGDPRAAGRLLPQISKFLLDLEVLLGLH